MTHSQVMGLERALLGARAFHRPTVAPDIAPVFRQGGCCRGWMHTLSACGALAPSPIESEPLCYKRSSV